MAMSTRTIVRDIARTQRCIRRTYQTTARDPPPPNRNDAGILSRFLAPEKFPFHVVPRPKVAAEYSPDIYLQSKVRALREENPTPTELDELFQVMDRDSPQGEMKHEAMTIWREMRAKAKIPTQDGYVALLKIAAEVGDVLMQDEIVGTFPRDNVPLIQPMVHYLLEGLIKNHEVDRAILLFRDIRARKIRPRNRTYHLMISLCAQNREPEEAFNILMNYKEVYGESQIPERMWWTVLQVCAQENFALGTLHCWQFIQSLENVMIPEGLCLQVLSVAGRHGEPALATSVFEALSNLGVTYREHHFLPLIEAYVQAGDIRQAFIVLSIMRESSLTPPQISTLGFLVSAISSSIDNLDKAFFALQDLVLKEGKRIDITAFNALLQGCILLQDASRAISTYREAQPLKVTPNLETFNILLHAAQIVGHTELAMYILSDLKAAQITPNEDTYGRIIITYLAVPGPEYDHAFLYLEEMKKAGYIPSSGIYATFVKKCVYHNDDRAWTVLEEMERCGYRIKELTDYIRNAEQSDARDPRMRRSQLKMQAYVRRKEAGETEEMFRGLRQIVDPSSVEQDGVVGTDI